MVKISREQEPEGLDPITVEVVGSSLLAAADEMGENLVRSSFSTNIKERRDCSTAILDSSGGTIAQAAHQPVHLGSTFATGLADFYRIAVLKHRIEGHDLPVDRGRDRMVAEVRVYAVCEIQRG